MTHESEFEPVVQILTAALNTGLPADVESKMRSRLESLRHRMEVTSIAPPVPGRKQPWRWGQWTRLMGLCAAVFVAAVMLLRFGSPSALAQLSTAVAGKVWLHGSGTGPDGEPAEIWFSGKHGVLARRTGDSYVFVDHLQGTMDVFGKPARGGSIHRTKLKHIVSQGVHAANRSFLALLGGDLQKAMNSDDRTVLEHTEAPIHVDGRELIEHHFVVGRSATDPSTSENRLLVDPGTKLPISWRMKIGDKQMFDYQISYPDAGPLSIVALGLPANTPIDEQSPSADFKQVLRDGKTTRLRFDDYHAVAIESFKFDEVHRLDFGYRIWRKGTRWRIDQIRWRAGTPIKEPELSDPKYWLNLMRTERSFPVEICDGKELWSFSPVRARQAPDTELPTILDPIDPDFVRIDSLTVINHCNIMSPGDPEPQNGSSRDIRPDFWGYEHLTRFAQLGFAVVTRRSELAGKVTTFVEGIEKPIFGSSPNASGSRYWLDPQRGNLIVRKEFFNVSQPNTTTGASEVVEATTTPQGLWYPTVIRNIGNSYILEDGIRGDTYHRYFLEFDAELPEELFDPKSVDLNNVWTQMRSIPLD